MISFICSGCGGFGHTPEVSLDSGTTLTCDGCGAPTVVELFSPAGYKKRHDIELQKDALCAELRYQRELWGLALPELTSGGMVAFGEVHKPITSINRALDGCAEKPEGEE